MITFSGNKVMKNGRYLGTIVGRHGFYEFEPVAGAVLDATDMIIIAGKLNTLK